MTFQTPRSAQDKAYHQELINLTLDFLRNTSCSADIKLEVSSCNMPVIYIINTVPLKDVYEAKIISSSLMVLLSDVLTIICCMYKECC